MIPVGRWLVPAFSVTMVLAIVAGRWMILRRARRMGIGHEVIAPLYLCALLAGFAGAMAGPLLHSKAGLTSFGGAVGALVAAVLFCRLRGYSYERTLWMFDLLAFGGTAAAALGRLGCTLAHDHRGLLSTSWLAVRFPEGPRYDLGLIDFVFLSALFGVFCWLDRRPRPAGFFVIALAIAYSAFRILRAELEVQPHIIGWVMVCLAGTAGAFFRPDRFARHLTEAAPQAP